MTSSKVASLTRIQDFLTEFIDLMDRGQFVLSQRVENINSLSRDFGMPPSGAEDEIRRLTPTDYFRGPTEDPKCTFKDAWEFGMMVEEETEAYIKLSIFRNCAYCISFHKAFRPIDYPHKNKGLSIESILL